MGFSSRFTKFWPRHSLGSGIAVVYLLAALLLAPFSQVSAESNPTSAPVSNGTTARRIGPTSLSLQLSLAFGLKITNQADLDQVTEDIYSPTSPNYKHFLSSQQFTQRFTSQVDRGEVNSFLKGQGFTVKDSGLGVLVNATATVAQVEQTFGITISDYQDRNTGKVFYRNDTPVILPQALMSRINSIFGLSNDTHFYPRTMRISPDKVQPRNNGTPSGCSDAVNIANAYNSFTPNQLTTAYNFSPFYSQSITGTGQTVAVYELDDYADNNVATYQTCFGTSVPVQRVPVNGWAGSLGSGQSEVELDIEVVAGMAPGLTKILVYEADPSGSTSYLDEFQKIANDDLAQVVSISWGDCEGDPSITSGVLDTENTIFQQMATQGQSVFSASGDYGAQGCLPITGDKGLYASDILDTPYVTGVGGTRLNLNNDNTINTEVTWNDFDTDTGASGGGVSNYFARPSWQIGQGTDGKYSNGKRMTPDVSAAASPYTSYVVYSVDGSGNPAWEPIGGTSASSPLWAAAAALTNNYLVSYSQPVLGFANPTIYRIFNSSGNAMTYHDITVGDDCYDATTSSPPHVSTCGIANSGSGIYPATSGYDMAAGIGTLNAYNFARNSCMLNVTSTADSGSGSLRNMASSAASPTAPCKMIALSSTYVGSSTIQLNSALTISGNVTLIGPGCTNTGPTFNIIGANTSVTGLTLTGGSLYGIKISGFAGPQLVAEAGPNYLKCVKTSKS